jgi:hypothetical protein
MACGPPSTEIAEPVREGRVSNLLIEVLVAVIEKN